MIVLRFSEVARRLGCSGRTVDRKLEEGGPYYDPDFPRPVQTGENSKRIPEHELDDYIRLLMARRDAELKGESVSETEPSPESPTPESETEAGAEGIPKSAPVA